MFSVLIVSALGSASFCVTLTIFPRDSLQWVLRIMAGLTISVLFSLYLLPGTKVEDSFWGQNPGLVSVLRCRVVSDSRERDGGIKYFTADLLFAENQNNLGTGARGRLTLASDLTVYKGQLITVRKKNLLYHYSRIIFLNKRQIEVTGWENNLTGWLLERRAGFLNFLSSRVYDLPPEVSSFFSALFLGVRENPRGGIYTSLRRSGGSHILALSGLHLSIVAVGVMAVFKFLFNRRVGFVLTMFFVLIYASIVGFSPSLTRAVILFGFAGTMGIMSLKKDTFHILILSFLFQAVIFPESTQTLSFQLSYLALGGIILWSPGICRLLPGIIPPEIRAILAASFSAQISTSIPVIHSFGLIYPIGIISGVVLLPLITAFIWIGIAGLFPLPFILRESWVWLMQRVYGLIKISAEYFSDFPAMSIKGLQITASIVFGVCLVNILSEKLKKQIELTEKSKGPDST